MFDEHRDATRSMLRRAGVVSVDDSGDFQRMTLTGLKGEQFSNVPRSHDFGFASNPPPGSEGLLLPQGGRADRAWAMGFEHQRYRQRNLPSGATALYDMAGNVISLLLKGGAKFKFDGNAWIVTCKGATITSDGADIAVDPGASNKIYLGGKSSSGTYAAVSTTSGPSTNVFARTG
jgi:phage baseplate assembly protein V